MTYTEFNPSPLRINQWFGESRSAAITCDLLWQNAAGHTQCHLTCEESFQILVDRIESIRGDYTSAWSRYKEPLLICIHPPLIRTMTLSNHLIQCISMNIGRTAKENYDDVNSYSKIVFIINFCIIIITGVYHYFIIMRRNTVTMIPLCITCITCMTVTSHPVHTHLY